MKTLIYLPLIVLLLLSVATVANSETDDAHEHEIHEQDAQDTHAENKSGDGHEEHEEGVVELSKIQQQTAGIVVVPLQEQKLPTEIRVPGEVKRNAYSTAKVTTRVTAQVVKRHVVLGEHVKSGQSLVTLSSVDMADAQGALLMADKEWRRVKGLGAKVASDRRYTEARVTRQLAYAKVGAYGMTPQEIEVLLNSGDARKANGEFQLIAPRDGTVVQDEFIEGALIEPGHVLLTIADETSLWVEARLTPQQLEGIRVGALARVQTTTGGLTGKVTQLHHNIDETTRTIAVRVSVTNPDDQLHPGEFVDVLLQNDQQEFALAVPDSAVVRSPDGDWQVFVEEHDDEFRAVEVEVLHSSGGYSRIGGLKPGTRVVTQGAFFVQSELAKSGFDIHNH